MLRGSHGPIAILLLAALALAGLPAHPAQAAPNDEAIRDTVKGFAVALADRDLRAFQSLTQLPLVLIRGTDDDRAAQVQIIRPDKLAEQLRSALPLPGGKAFAADLAPKLTTTWFGRDLAIAVHHPKPRIGVDVGPGVVAVVARPPDQGWRVVCFVVGPATVGPADGQTAIRGSIVAYWRALFTHDVDLLRKVVQLPYTDIGHDQGGADIQSIDGRLLQQLGGSKGGPGAGDFDPTQLVSQLELRFLGQNVAVAFYASGVADFSKGPHDFAILVRDSAGKWRIATSGSA